MPSCNRILTVIATLLLPPLGLGLVTGYSRQLVINIALFLFVPLAVFLSASPLLSDLVDAPDNLDVLLDLIGGIFWASSTVHALCVEFDYVENQATVRNEQRVQSRAEEGRVSGDYGNIAEEGRASRDSENIAEDSMRGEQEKY